MLDRRINFKNKRTSMSISYSVKIHANVNILEVHHLTGFEQIF